LLRREEAILFPTDQKQELKKIFIFKNGNFTLYWIGLSIEYLNKKELNPSIIEANN